MLSLSAFLIILIFYTGYLQIQFLASALGLSIKQHSQFDYDDLYQDPCSDTVKAKCDSVCYVGEVPRRLSRDEPYLSSHS